MQPLTVDSVARLHYTKTGMEDTFLVNSLTPVSCMKKTPGQKSPDCRPSYGVLSTNV